MQAFEPSRSAADYQAIVATALFCVGVRCSSDEVLGLDYLPLTRERPGETPLAAEVERQLKAYLGDPGFVFCLPLRPAGTAFQRRVWAEITTLSHALPVSYGELARRLRSGPRAVGQACGANPYPLVVPCHRVIAAGGGLGGFARNGGGFLLQVKRWLLTHEGVILRG